MKQMKSYTNVDEYISNFSPEIQEHLTKIRQTIQQAAPDAVEAISYGIPTYKLHGNLVHFGGYDTHIGFYPGSEAIEVFNDKLSQYELSKGTVRFPLDKPIPYNLVGEITQYRVEKSTAKRK